MPQAVLQKLIEETIKANPKCAEFDWLGGEPTLAGVDFFDEVVSIQSHYRLPNQVVTNKLQTNGTMLNERWVKFLIANDFHLGISIDGPPELHDIYRRDNGDNPTALKVLNSIKLLQELGHKRWGTITVITDQNVDYPEVIYNFFRSVGITKMAFNPTKGTNESGKQIAIAPSPTAYGNFMCRIFDRWCNEDNPESFTVSCRDSWGANTVSVHFLGSASNSFPSTIMETLIRVRMIILMKGGASGMYLKVGNL